jgi:hypothetical protein
MPKGALGGGAAVLIEGDGLSEPEGTTDHSSLLQFWCRGRGSIGKKFDDSKYLSGARKLLKIIEVAVS